jgi:hypothetical protein
MATGSLAVYKTSHLTESSDFFEYMPPELFREVIKYLNPISLRAFMETSKKHYSIVVSNIPYLVSMYSRAPATETETFMWSSFDLHSPTNPVNLFVKMIGVYKFAQEISNNHRLEDSWETLYLDTHDNYGPLPTDEDELYDLQFKTGILYGLFDVCNDLDTAAQFAYSSETLEIFTFLYKLLINHPGLYSDRLELLDLEVKELVEEHAMTFEMFEDIYRQIAYYTDSIVRSTLYDLVENRIFRVILYSFADHFLRLVKYGVPVEYALDSVSEDYTEYSDIRLEVYNAVRHIISDKLAIHYILEKEIAITPLPENFLENVRRMLSIGVTKTRVIDAFLANPTYDLFINIAVQLELTGTVVLDFF